MLCQPSMHACCLQSDRHAMPWRVPMLFLILTACCGCPGAPPAQQGPTSRWIRIEAEPDGSSSGARGRAVTVDDFEELAGAIPTIARAVAESHLREDVKGADGEVEARISMATPDLYSLLQEATGAKVRDGRFLSSQDLETDAAIAVIDEAVAGSLFRLKRPIGASVTIAGREFTIVGILSHSKPSHMGDVVRDIYIPLQAPQTEPTQKDDDSRDRIDRIWLEVATLDQVEMTQKVVRSVLSKNHPGAQFSITSSHFAQ